MTHPHQQTGITIINQQLFVPRAYFLKRGCCCWFFPDMTTTQESRTLVATPAVQHLAAHQRTSDTTMYPFRGMNQICSIFRDAMFCSIFSRQSSKKNYINQKKCHVWVMFVSEYLAPPPGVRDPPPGGTRCDPLPREALPRCSLCCWANSISSVKGWYSATSNRIG